MTRSEPPARSAPLFAPWPDITGYKAAFFDGLTKEETITAEFLGAGTPSVSLKQIHSNKVVTVERAGGIREEGDALVTKLSNVALHVYTADCLPLLASDGNVIGACHAGWRGLSTGIIENWIGALGALGAERGKLRVAVGPAIGKCHFEVGRDVGQQILSSVPVKFLEALRAPHPDDKKEFVDLKETARFKLLALGLSAANLIFSPECTYCGPHHLPSYRRDGKRSGRLQGVIVKSHS